MKETKKERFKRLATHRTKEILKRINILGHCANRSAYEYSEDQIAAIFSVLEKKLKETRNKFNFSARDNFSL